MWFALFCTSGLLSLPKASNPRRLLIPEYGASFRDLVEFLENDFDELNNMQLEYQERLSKSPKEAAEFLLSKILSLEYQVVSLSPQQAGTFLLGKVPSPKDSEYVKQLHLKFITEIQSQASGKTPKYYGYRFINEICGVLLEMDKPTYGAVCDEVTRGRLLLTIYCVYGSRKNSLMDLISIAREVSRTDKMCTPMKRTSDEEWDIFNAQRVLFKNWDAQIVILRAWRDYKQRSGKLNPATYKIPLGGNMREGLTDYNSYNEIVQSQEDVGNAPQSSSSQTPNVPPNITPKTTQPAGATLSLTLAECGALLLATILQQRNSRQSMAQDRHIVGKLARHLLQESNLNLSRTTRSVCMGAWPIARTALLQAKQSDAAASPLAINYAAQGMFASLTELLALTAEAAWVAVRHTAIAAKVQPFQEFKSSVGLLQETTRIIQPITHPILHKTMHGSIIHEAAFRAMIQQSEHAFNKKSTVSRIGYYIIGSIGLLFSRRRRKR